MPAEYEVRPRKDHRSRRANFGCAAIRRAQVRANP
jgi:hypothetical protein